MSKAFPDSTVWFVTGSQHLYGEEALRQVAADATTIARGLDAADAIPVAVSLRPVVTDPDGIRGLLEAADADPACVGVIAWMHTFSPSKMWIAGLRSLRMPLALLHTLL
jgi:L-arabinose isomerase